jgi:hypothetical protein
MPLGAVAAEKHQELKFPAEKRRHFHPTKTPLSNVQQQQLGADGFIQETISPPLHEISLIGILHTCQHSKNLSRGIGTDCQGVHRTSEPACVAVPSLSAGQ